MQDADGKRLRLRVVPPIGLGITEDWYAVRDRAYEALAVDWLKAYDIPFVRGDEE